MAVVLQNSCTLCGDCVTVCENEALEIREGRLVVDSQKCDECGVCIAMCCSRALDYPWCVTGNAV